MTDAALAVRDYSDSQIKQRITLNQKAGYGLEKATAAQLNIVFLLCQRYDLDPVEDLTLYEGRPWITVSGRLRLLRRHPEYRGFDCRPLSKDEKEAWGYAVDDIVVEATVRTERWGDIRARGKVSAAEMQAARSRAQESGRRAAPIAIHPVEIAEKRAIGRAERAAFGQDAILDEDQVDEAIRTVVTERNDPERIKRNSAEYDRTIGAADWGERDPYQTISARESVPSPVVGDDASADATSNPPDAAGALVPEQQGF